MSRTRDTSAEAYQAQLQSWRSMGPEGRVAVALDLSDGIRTITMDGIANRHPEYDSDQLRHAMFRLMLGDELYRAAWPDRALLAS